MAALGKPSSKAWRIEETGTTPLSMLTPKTALEIRPLIASQRVAARTLSTRRSRLPPSSMG